MENPAAALPELRAESIGGMAKLQLQTSPRLTVAAVFDNSFYLATPSGQLSCVLGPGKEPGPLHIICQDWPADLRGRIAQGEEVAARFPLLHFRRLRLDLSTGEKWHPPTPARPRRDILCQRLPSIIKTACAAAPPDALIQQLGSMPRNDVGHGGADGIESHLARFIQQGMENLHAAFVADRAATAERRNLFANAVTALLGLGNGLTPSGDDILAGTMLTLRLLGEHGDADLLADTVAVAAAAGATNRISAAHLAAAAAGQGSEAFHLFYSAAVGRRNREHLLLPLLRRINGIGHSSGWDTLFGMMRTLERWCGLATG